MVSKHTQPKEEATNNKWTEKGNRSFIGNTRRVNRKNHKNDKSENEEAVTNGVRGERRGTNLISPAQKNRTTNTGEPK